MTNFSQQERDQFLSSLNAEYNSPFSGWDFSHLDGRMVEDETALTWNYRMTVLSYLEKAQSLLDMGTGGGEYLASLQPLPPDTCATEGYEPNVTVAKYRLEPLGVTVCRVNGDLHLPFQDQRFVLVINRHESYTPQEVFRVLKPKGHFVTQQVGGHNYLDLNRLLGANEDLGMIFWNVDYAIKNLEAVGMHVLQYQEAFPVIQFFDVGAIVYYLKTIPWQIPDFSVEKYSEELIRAHQTIQTNGYLEVRSHRFFIVAQRP